MIHHALTTEEGVDTVRGYCSDDPTVLPRRCTGYLAVSHKYRDAPSTDGQWCQIGPPRSQRSHVMMRNPKKRYGESEATAL